MQTSEDPTTNMTSSKPNAQQGQPLKDALAAVLPVGADLSIRYVHSTPKRCQPLFSPIGDRSHEKTTLSSHFLTASLDSTDSTAGDVLIYAIEVLIYSTPNLTTLFISKADSTGYSRQSNKSSSVRTISTTFLRWLSHQNRLRHPEAKQVISLFARAQGQYLFPGSAENTKKHVLDDRQLIKWWVRVLDPLLGDCSPGEHIERRGFITVPGVHGVELRHFLPQTRDRWAAGNPLRELAALRNVPETAPTRCLLPRFPDDPKARFMQDLDDEAGLADDAGAPTSNPVSPSKRKGGRWTSIHDLNTFWEAMEFRQECSSGRLVGFLWLVTDFNGSNAASSDLLNGSRASVAREQQSSHDSTQTSKHAQKRKQIQKLSGAIVARLPRIKGSCKGGAGTAMTNRSDGNGLCLTPDGYDQAMQTLLHLDFSDIAIATSSTSKWLSEIVSICRLSERFWTLDVQGQSTAVEDVRKGPSAGQVHDLVGMTRRKKRSLDSTTTIAPAELEEKQSVNVLGGLLVRKKPKLQ